jgi:hypothetical protein
LSLRQSDGRSWEGQGGKNEVNYFFHGMRNGLQRVIRILRAPRERRNFQNRQGAGSFFFRQARAPVPPSLFVCYRKIQRLMVDSLFFKSHRRFFLLKIVIDNIAMPWQSRLIPSLFFAMACYR